VSLARPVTLVPSLTDLLADRSRVAELPCEVAAGLASEAADLRARADGLHTALLIRALAGSGTGREGPDRLLSVAEAACRLAVSQDYVYRHAAEWSFTVRRGRKLGFSEQGLAAHLRRPLDCR
jgi:hypothetical protein